MTTSSQSKDKQTKSNNKGDEKAGANAAPAPQEAPPIQLFQKRKRIYSRRVSGRFRSLKWVAMIVTLGIYYLAPFLRWDRGPGAPDQAILIDMPARRAYWFFIEIWPQEVYILTGILIVAAIGLFFFTSLFGRVWCGYVCPQTVWTDLFMWVERLVQGDRFARQKLDKAPWSLNKLWKKFLTHTLWLLICLCTAGAFVFYFNDAPTLLSNILEGDVSFTVLGFVAGLTISTYIMAGFAREQVCIYMCPYSRFQSAMFDKDTLIISYDETRGEPKTKVDRKLPEGSAIPCFDCTACVQVCPMGIDIRDGLQMECIACGLCIDACDEMMDKVGHARNLIRYTTSHILEEEKKAISACHCKGEERTCRTNVTAGVREQHKAKWRLIRPRTIYYTFVLLAVMAIMLAALVFRAPVELHVLHDRNPLFVKLSNGDVRNGYDVKILNKTYQEKVFDIQVEGLDGYTLEAKGAGNVDAHKFKAMANSVSTIRVFVKAPMQKEANKEITFTVRESGSDSNVKTDSMFVSRR